MKFAGALIQRKYTTLEEIYHHYWQRKTFGHKKIPYGDCDGISCFFRIQI